MKPEVKIESLSHYMELCQKYDNQLFRGESNVERQLIPTLFRYNFSFRDKGKFYRWMVTEKELLLRFKRKGAAYLNDTENDILELIAQARHYGLPTRFLDWSSNPLVALYFAVLDNTVDGIVYSLFGQATITKKLSKLSDLRSWLDDRVSHSILVYYPKHSNKRIVAQNGCFTVHQVPMLDVQVNSIKDLNFYKEGGQYLFKYTIPLKLKFRLRKKLDRLGINHYSLFPDADGLANHLKWTVNLESDRRSFNIHNLETDEI